MGFYNHLAKKYNINICKFDVAVVCPAINTKLWLDLHRELSTSKLSFVLIFIGHVRPSFKLPDNVIHIYTQMNVVHSGDIGYQYVFNNNLSTYMVLTADDQTFKPGFLDKIVESYKKIKLHYPDKALWVGPVSFQPNGSPDIMGHPSPLGYLVLISTGCIATEDAKKAGLNKSDKRLRGYGSHIEKQLRFYEESNGIIVVDDKISPTGEKKGTSTMAKTTASHDKNILKTLYTFSKTSDIKHEALFTNFKNGKNNFFKQCVLVKRSVPLDSLSSEELIFEEPNIEHLAIKF